jgi:WD40 repeat protein
VVTSASHNEVRSWSWASGGDVCAGPDPDLLALCAADQAATGAVTATGTGIYAAAASPDGSRLAVLDRRGAVWMFAVGPSAPAGEPLWRTTPPTAFFGNQVPIVWSPDGTRLLVDRFKWDVLDAGTGAFVHLKEKGILSEHSAPIFQAIWLDDHTLGAELGSTKLELHSASTGAVIGRLPAGTASESMSNVVGHRYAVAVNAVGDDVSLLDTRDGSTDQVFVGNGSAETLAVSPDGAFVAAGDEGGDIDIWEVSSGALVMSADVGHDVMGLAFESDDELYVNSLQDDVRRVDCAVCRPGDALLKLAADQISAPLDDQEAAQFGVSKVQRDG